MDYHLDWIAACLQAYLCKDLCKKPFPKPKGFITGTQQDTDLLIAFKEKDSGCYHLLLLEAKAYSAWDNSQLSSKAKQLKKIFGETREKYTNVKPHFYLAASKISKRLKTFSWPKWMKEDGENPCHWLKLDLPSNRLVVTRCNKEGKSDRKGCYFRISEVSREKMSKSNSR